MRGISKHFLGVQALSGVDLTVDSGEVLALVGENGAGKSTLIKVLSGAQRPDDGEVLIDGEPVQLHSPVDSERYGIATVYQELNLFPALSVAENLLFGRYPKRGNAIDWRATRAESRRFLAELGVHLDVDRKVGELSVAERQMLEIAKSLHREVRVLTLDEPTAVLGGSDVDALIAMVKSLRDRGVAVIFVSHRLDEVFDLADHYVVLKDGRRPGAGLIADTDHDGLVSMMVGRELAHMPDPTAGPRDEVVLAVEGLQREGVLSDINLQLHRGEVLGVAGLRRGTNGTARARSSGPTRSPPAASRSAAARSTPPRRARRSTGASGSCPRTADRRACSGGSRAPRTSRWSGWRRPLAAGA